MYKYKIIKCQILTNKYFLITTKQLFILFIHFFFLMFSNLFTLNTNFQMYAVYINLVNIIKFQRLKMKKNVKR